MGFPDNELSTHVHHKLMRVTVRRRGLYFYVFDEWEM
jgi:hypothetical protein